LCLEGFLLKVLGSIKYYSSIKVFITPSSITNSFLCVCECYPFRLLTGATAGVSVNGLAMHVVEDMFLTTAGSTITVIVQRACAGGKCAFVASITRSTEASQEKPSPSFSRAPSDSFSIFAAREGGRDMIAENLSTQDGSAAHGKVETRPAAKSMTSSNLQHSPSADSLDALDVEMDSRYVL
jgi:hypothetical protein